MRKVRIENCPEGQDEIVIRCSFVTPSVERLRDALDKGENLRYADDMALTLGDREYFIAIKDILFFESADKNTAAHTGDKMYYTDMKLFELTDSLPPYFMRVSKSTIANLKAISSVRRDVTGLCEAFFDGSPKKIYVSRMYYKPFREKLSEIRLNN